MARATDRERLIADLEARHIAPAFPRGQLTAMLAAAGLAGFLTSVGLLAAGVDQMWVRYPTAVAGAYAAFLGLLRLWIAWHRGELTPDVDWPWDSTTSAGQDRIVTTVAGGGRSGGAGGGANWEHAPALVRTRGAAPRPTSGGNWGFDVDLDLDDAWWLLVAGVLVLGGALAIVYVIYIAPVLLAEVALDAALVTTVYRRLRPHDVQHWSLGVVRRTWLPALVLALCLAGAGAALQQVAPGARSIGGVVAHLHSERDTTNLR
jgi:hypothetical protein